jgi:DedD protein
MARPISDEELDLKKRARRRLVGAIVLVTAVAVVLPMVLDTEPKPVSQNVDIQIPAPDASEFKLKGVAPAAAPAAKAPAPPAEPNAEPPKLQMDSKVATEVITRLPEAAKPPAKDATKADKAVDVPKAGAGGPYVVQVEALADAAKAKQLQEKVAAAGLPAYTEVVSTKTGELTRVRAGPYESREAAEKARSQLKKAGFDGKVVAK